MGWLIFIGVPVVYAVFVAVFGVVPALWVATVILSTLIGFLYGVGKTLASQGTEAGTAKTGTGLVHDGPSPQGCAERSGISTTKHTQGEG